MVMSGEELPVERTVLDGLQDVVGADVRGTSKIGEGAGGFEDPVVGTCGETHFLHGALEVAGTFRIQLAMLADLAGRHGGVGGMAGLS